MSEPTVLIALAVGRLRDRYKADGVPEADQQVIGDLTAALTFTVGPSLLADHDERVMRRLLAYAIEHADDLVGDPHGGSHVERALRTLSENLPPEVFRG